MGAITSLHRLARIIYQDIQNLMLSKAYDESYGQSVIPSIKITGFIMRSWVYNRKSAVVRISYFLDLPFAKLYFPFENTTLRLVL